MDRRTPALPSALEALGELSRAARDALGRGHVRQRFARGAQVLYKGARVSGAYLVDRGRLRVYTLSPEGTEATLYGLVAGETCIFAINSLFQDLLYPAWVEAETDSEVVLIPGALFRGLFSTERPIRDLTLRALSRAVFALMGELERVHFTDVRHRLVSFILTRASSAGVLSLTHQEIALRLGTSREVVSRHLKALADAGTVRIRRGATIVLDAQRLSEMLGAG